MSMQTTTLIGTISKEPEVKTTTHGAQYVEITIPHTIYKKSGEKTQWWRCTAWAGYADVMINLIAKGALTKGRHVAVIGQVDASAWTDRNGELQVTYELLIDKLQLIGKAPSKDQSE